MAVGAPNEDGNSTSVISASNQSATDAGAVYIFTRSGTNWLHQAYLKASNAGVGDLFGSSIALSGDGNTLAVGAPLENGSSSGIGGAQNDLADDAGAVYVFTRGGTSWSQQTYVKASNTGPGDRFGVSVALTGDGNMLAVGAPFEDSSGKGIGSTSNESTTDAGAVYIYTRSAGIWSPKVYVKAPNTGMGDLFGRSVTLSSDGNTLAVGAVGENSSTTGIGTTPNESAADAGAVYLY